MKGRRHLWIIAFLALVGVMLVACGGGGEPPTPTQVPSTPTPAATPTPAPTSTPSAGDHVEMGMEYYEQGELEKAIAEFEIAIELDPEDAEAHRNLGTAYGEQNKWEEATVAYEKAIELAPDFGEAYGDLAAAYFNLGKPAEAVTAGEKGIELNPEYAMSYNNLAVVYGSQGNLDQAINLLTQAIEVDPDCADAHYNLGYAYEGLGQPQDAVAEYQEAIRADPDYADAYENMGSVYAQQGQLDEAISWWQKTLEIEPERASTYQNLGMAYAQQGKNDEAIAAFATYLELTPPEDPGRAQVEGWIAELRGSEAGGAAEHRNAKGGYSMLYPEGWYVTGRDTETSLAPSKEDYEAPTLQSPLITFITWPLAEATRNFALEEDAGPEEFLVLMAERLESETGEVESAEIAGYPAAFAATSGTLEGASYGGDLIIILAGDRLFLAEALAPSDQWDQFRPTFVEIINSLSFFEPSE